MKKLLLSFILGILSLHAFSQTPVVNPPSAIPGIPIHWQAYYENPYTGGLPTPKSPAQSPVASVDDHTFYIYNMDVNVTIQLFDEDGNEAYSTVIPAGTSSIELPSDLNGDFSIQLHNGGIYYFVGYINF